MSTHKPHAAIPLKGRRNFMMAAGMGAALATLLGRGPVSSAATAATPAPPAPEAGGGYRESEHVRKYYRCARYW